MKTALDFYESGNISPRLGRAPVSTTADIYSHVIKEAGERISDYYDSFQIVDCFIFMKHIELGDKYP